VATVRDKARTTRTRISRQTRDRESDHSGYGLSVPFPRFRGLGCSPEPFFIKYFNIVKCNESWCSLYVVSLTVHYSERFA
jgi:hypothetical protein